MCDSDRPARTSTSGSATSTTTGRGCRTPWRPFPPPTPWPSPCCSATRTTDGSTYLPHYEEGSRRTGVRVELAAVLGPDPRLLPAASREVRTAAGTSPDGDTGLVLACAGTTDASAKAALNRLALRWRRQLGADVRVADAAATGARVGETVVALRAAGCTRVDVAAWFLAPGLLLDRASAEALRRRRGLGRRSPGRRPRGRGHRAAPLRRGRHPGGPRRLRSRSPRKLQFVSYARNVRRPNRARVANCSFRVGRDEFCRVRQSEDCRCRSEENPCRSCSRSRTSVCRPTASAPARTRPWRTRSVTSIPGSS